MGLIVVIVLLGLLGYLLGVIGFFRAGAALRETRQLRKLLSQEIAKRNAERTAASPSSDSALTIDPVVPIDDASQGSVDSVVFSTPEPAVETAPDPIEATPQKAGGSSDASGQRDFESVLATRWGVWLGAVALLFAGVFLVRYAAEHAVLGPAARCWAAVGLGIALLAGAEWTARRDKPDLAVRLGADQAPAALAAGGVATLFGASYGAGPFYGLLPPLLAFAAMAASSFLGLLAALRFGPLTAAVGIVGAFAAPALVTTQDPSLVGTFLYLLLATAAAHAVVRRTAWTWLAWAVTIAGAAWILAATLVPDDAEIWAPASFVPLSALIGLLLLPAAAMDATVGRWLAKGQFAMIASAGLAFEAMVPGVAARTAVFALSPVAAWYGARESRLDGLPWLAAACGLVVLYFWDGVGQVGLLLRLASVERRARDAGRASNPCSRIRVRRGLRDVGALAAGQGGGQPDALGGPRGGRADPDTGRLLLDGRTGGGRSPMGLRRPSARGHVDRYDRGGATPQRPHLGRCPRGGGRGGPRAGRRDDGA